MTTDNLCQQCSAPLSPSDPQGLCPRCLLQAGIGSDETTVAMAGARRLIAPPAFPFDFGDYRVLRLLGRGGMGAVYEAERRDTGRRVALKVLGHAIDSEEMRRRFLREGRLAASVNHPNTVYIFGSEEIGGEPVIAMELIVGGTLRDLLRKGPLDVRDAVDAILQVIAGLEAAADAGVLHRDVKPENCFVAPDGTVKVGDFGLSVSTLARGDTQLTASGAMLGTPAFAPPEQLSGEDLDVRADIYSTGATLYALLTGSAPFAGDNAVHVVAAVLNKAPKPVEEFRTDVPSGLSQTVMRCLAKKREDRPAGYAALRDALLPFSSYVPEPAPVGMRMLAGMADWLILPSFIIGSAVGITLDYRFLAERTTATALAFLGVVLADVAYFAIPEWLWGASIGKALCGLRVAPRAILPVVMRALIVMLAINLGVLGHWFISSGAEFKVGMQQGEFRFLDMVGPSLLLLLFVTMRRSNGFAAVHDLLTGTRVILRPKVNARPRLGAAPETAPEPGEGERIGPFRVTGVVGGSWLAGYDDMLRRTVWIRTCAKETPAMSPARRDIGRAGRLRWIAGARDESGGWDAFDAPAGKPLAELTKQPWNAVRCWLLDLAEEIDAASADGTLPAEISAASVWITADGRAVLLDEPRGASDSLPAFAGANIGDSQRFLAAIAESAMDRSQLPLHARDFTAKLAAAKFDRATFLIGNLRSLLAKPASISRWRRFASLTAAPALIFVLVTVTMWAVRNEARREKASWASYPELRMLSAATELYKEVDETPDVKVHAGKYIAGHFGPFIDGEESNRHPNFQNLSAEERSNLREIVRQHSPVTKEELAAADDVVGSSLDISAGDVTLGVREIVQFLMGPIIGLMAAVQLISLLVFGVTPGQRIFGFAVVNARGEPAGRWRMLGRWAVIWLPFLLFFAFAMSAAGSDQSWRIKNIIGLLVSGGVWFLCIGRAVMRPARGVHDELARTSIVPR